MFGKRGVVSIANRSEEKKPVSQLRDTLSSMGVCFSFGVLAWYLIRPLFG
jgi:hypothetical protein